ncbi:MAG: nitrite reductase, copper-containing [Opitutaceae bacterium]|nr:nitrite reductase, copper-containing [Opitutaceae bacterium]
MKNARFLAGILLAAASAFAADGPSAALGPVQLPPDVAALPVEEAILTAPPHVPPPIKRRTPARVVIHLEVREVTSRIADGTQYTFWTFGGSVPGSFLRVRKGDVVEFHLNNHPSSKLPHNIDLHAVTGSGGGASSTFTAPGHSSQFTFKALNPGLFVYHCATAPVPMHIGNGMYGLILVEPEEGLPPVDKEYYVMQGEFYTNGPYAGGGLQLFDTPKSIDERPTYVLFNGSVGSIVGDKSLTAEVGQNVRIYFGVGGPNLTSSFHVIGEIFDKVYVEAGTHIAQHNVQTTMVPSGGAAIVDFKVDVPGTYVLVDHSLSRAFNKGALGMLKVTGPEDRVIYSGKEVDAVYLGSAADAGTIAAKRQDELQEKIAAAIKSNPTIANLTKEVQMAKGKQIYMQNCFACHLPTGEGIAGVFPPLAKSDFMMADRERAIRIVLKGLNGPITVNGQAYNGVMPPQSEILNEEQMADVLTYVTNMWGNSADAYTVDEIRKVKGE